MIPDLFQIKPDQHLTSNKLYVVTELRATTLYQVKKEDLHLECIQRRGHISATLFLPLLCSSLEDYLDFVETHL